ncbi:MAG: ABC transporter substrate-binding protein [Deltaproteobacteria bacterium]|nr:ABC transporter substrate-binding protein [Deltaproteobacteria bacterium]
MEPKRDALMAFGFFFAVFYFGHAQPVRGADASPLARIIEGAKKEGTVTVQISPSSHTAQSMKRLAKEIEKRYKVALDIQFSPTERMAVELSKALMEHKVGSAPTYDLMSLSVPNIVRGIEAGIYEKVEWQPLLDKETPPEVILGKPGTPYHGHGLVSYTAHRGLMYNPKRIPPESVPKTLAELADPRWKGKVGIHNYPRVWAEVAFVSGKEKVLSALGAIMRNKAIQGAYADLQKRYLLEEIWLAHSGSQYFQEARMKGVPAEWESLELSDIAHYVVSVRTRARHPNAAKLVAIYLASPQGTKIHVEEAGAGNVNYSGNYENGIAVHDRKQGLPQFAWDHPGRMEFVISKKAEQWEKEIERIFKGGY